MRVDYAQLSLSSAVLRRQSDQHVPAMISYVQQYSVLTPADTGIILLPFSGISLAVSVVGVQILEGIGTVLRTAADKVDSASAAYAAEEQRVYQAAAQTMQRLGVGMPPFADPRQNAPSLPAAAGGAPAGHGDAEPWLFEQAYQAGQSIVTGTSGIVDDVSSAASGWVSGATGIVERQDPASYLVAPNAQKSEVESMRWGAGPLLGGIDWVFEQIAGFSLLEDVIMKPFAGDWTGIEEVSLAWQYLGESSRAIADNAAGLVEQGEFWEGQAGLAFRGGMVAIGGVMYGVGAACDSVSGTVGTLVLVSKSAAATIGFILNKISVKLLRIAAEAAIPIAGWIAAAVEGAILVTEIFSLVRLIYTIVDTIFDAIESAVQARAQLVETLLLVEDLMQFLVNTGARYAR
ncbi:MAG: hypothetical protein K0Q58_1441 [Microbacterium sp.]|jgi:hypothetical protein|nr:hypothetical protein [Microbacterium sp.]